jgi:hypothetical protein
MDNFGLHVENRYITVWSPFELVILQRAAIFQLFARKSEAPLVGRNAREYCNKSKNSFTSNAETYRWRAHSTQVVPK